MPAPSSILSFERVALEAGELYESAVCDIDFDLGPGELMLVRLDREHLLLPLADAAQGLAAPLEGRVRFLGTDWQTLSPDAAARQRGRIGRIFPGGGWLSNLDMDENIILAQRHHTQRPDRALFEEAAGLARRFGLPGLPWARPANYRRQDLQKAACVRAFLGDPVLILAEDPTRHAYADIIAPLANMVFAARRRGAAVLWATSNPEVWHDAGLRPTSRRQMSGSQMHPAESVA